MLPNPRQFGIRLAIQFTDQDPRRIQSDRQHSIIGQAPIGKECAAPAKSRKRRAKLAIEVILLDNDRSDARRRDAELISLNFDEMEVLCAERTFHRRVVLNRLDAKRRCADRCLRKITQRYVSWEIYIAYPRGQAEERAHTTR